MDPSSDTVGKRKRETEQAVSNKRALKRKRKAKSIATTEQETDAQNDINEAIGRMDSSLLADHIIRSIRRFEPDLTTLELEDQYHVPERVIRDTSAWNLRRTSDNLAQYLERVVEGDEGAAKLSSAAESCGCPHTVVVTAAGLRAADLTRSLRKFQSKNATVAKLFAKHIKLKEARDMVKKTRIGIGVGTPQRLIDLLDDGALSIEHLERIVVDASHINQKKRGILDMKETAIPLGRFLARDELKSRYSSEQKKISLLFF